MNIPVNLFMWIMAFLPIAALLILMIKCGWGATEAAPVGLLITVVTGVAFYKADITLLASESAKGVWKCTDHIDHCMDCNSDVSDWR